MTLHRRWLFTVIGFVAAGIAVEVAVGIGINLFNAYSGARIWLENGRSGTVALAEEHVFLDLEKEGDELVGRAPGLDMTDLAGVARDVRAHVPADLAAGWLVAGGAVVHSGMPECDADLSVTTRLAARPARAIVWCGRVPVVLARVLIEERGGALYLGRALGQAWVDEIRKGSLNEVELRGPHGAIATTFALAGGTRATQSFTDPLGDFGRCEVDLGGPYAGYFPDSKGLGVYANRLKSAGATRFDVFAVSSALDPKLGPPDLQVVLAVPADMMMLGPLLGGGSMIAVGLLVLVGLGFLARRLVNAVSRPLAELERAASAAAKGQAGFEANENSGTFEVSSISSSFATMSARAAQSEKMAALGTLAGGVAHEINNPLGVILGFAQGMERRVPEGDPLRMPVASIVREALRCKSLVQELLIFSRVGKRTDEPVDFAAAVQSSLVLLGARAKTQGVEMVTDVAAVLPTVRGSRTQLQQVLMNLGSNALDAMKGGGTLTVRAAAAGEEIVLEVVDTGHGIAQDIRARVFDPFFTTKGPGEGTGLGLSLVYQIVQQHHGRVDIASTAPGGTVMRVWLPVQAEVRA